MDEGFGKELECRAVSGVCVLSWILLVEQLTNNGPTLALRWTYTGQTTDRRWPFAGPSLDKQRADAGPSLNLHWSYTLSTLSPLSQRDGRTLLHDWFFGPKWIKNVLYEKKCVSLQM